eukprot:11191193-Ditylum_brightwellii.AAC.1
MGFVPNSGDALTYYIRTEGKKPQYLIWSIICSRRKHIGTEQEHVNEGMSEQKDELDEIVLEFLDKDDNVIKDLDSGEDGMPPLALRKDKEDEDEDEDKDKDKTSLIEIAGEAILDTPKQNWLDESSSPKNKDSGE